MVSALQNLVTHHSGSLPAGVSFAGVTPSRRLRLDWAKLATGLLPPEGSIESSQPTLIALQLIAASPAFDAVCPLIRARLAAFGPLVQPPFPSVLSSHLVESPGHTTAGDLDRFSQVRTQLARLLRLRPRVRTLLRKEFNLLFAPYLWTGASNADLSVSELYAPAFVDAPGLIDNTHLVDAVCTLPISCRTSYAEELAALLRRERYGVMVDNNYVVIRHEGVALDVITTGDHPAWLRAETIAEAVPEAKRISAAANLRDWLRETFRTAGQDTCVRIFERTDQLQSVSYSPANFTVIYRADASAFIKRAEKTTGQHLSRGERPPRHRRLKEITVRTPAEFADLVTTPTLSLGRKNETLFINIDAFNNIPPGLLVNLAAKDFAAYNEAGAPCYRFRDVPATLFVSLSVLATHLKQPALSAHLQRLYGSKLDWKKAFNEATDAKRRKRAKAYPFTIAEDTYLSLYARKWKRADFWGDFLKRFPHHSLARLRRRAAYVRAILNKRGTTIAQLHDAAWLDANIKGVALRRWKSIYKAIEEIQ
jgi:hypothetical protein